MRFSGFPLGLGFTTWAFLSCMDCFLALFVLFPLAIFHWRGTWDLLDYYIMPNNLVHSGWTCVVIGINGGVLGNLFQPLLHRCLVRQRKWVYAVVSRLYLYLLGWTIMCFWRGSWDLMDYYLTEGWRNSLIIYFIAQIITLITLTSKTNCGVPVNIVVDTDPDVMKPSTWADVSFFDNLCGYLADTFFTQVVVVACNVAVWRGIWNILDAFLFPENHVVSDFASLGIGYSVLILLFCIQYPSGLLSARLDKRPTCKLLFEDTLFLVATWANLFLWRGGWDLCVAYVMPGQLRGSWACHAIGSISLLVVQGFSNVGSNMTDIDGRLNNGENVFPLDYIRSFIRVAADKKAALGGEDAKPLIDTDEEEEDSMGELIYEPGTEIIKMKMDVTVTDGNTTSNGVASWSPLNIGSISNTKLVCDPSPGPGNAPNTVISPHGETEPVPPEPGAPDVVVNVSLSDRAHSEDITGSPNGTDLSLCDNMELQSVVKS